MKRGCSLVEPPPVEWLCGGIDEGGSSRSQHLHPSCYAFSSRVSSDTSPSFVAFSNFCKLSLHPVALVHVPELQKPSQLVWDSTITLIRLVRDFNRMIGGGTGMHGTWVPHTGEQLSTTGVPVKRPVEATGPGTPTRPLPFVLSSQNIVELSHWARWLERHHYDLCDMEVVVLQSCGEK